MSSEYRTVSVRIVDHEILSAVASVRGIHLVDLVEELAAWALDELENDQRKLADALIRLRD